MSLATPHPRVIADVWAPSWAREAVLVIGSALFVALAGQVTIPLPFTPVPLTGQTFAVLLSAAAIGGVRSLTSMILYVAMAFAGLPVLPPNDDGSHLTGAAVLAAPSFGYLIGFVVAAAVVGRLAERGYTRTPLRTAGLMALGNVVIYALGVPWLMASVGIPVGVALSLGVVPFLIGDLLKIAMAAGLLPLTWRGLRRAGLSD